MYTPTLKSTFVTTAKQGLLNTQASPETVTTHLSAPAQDNILLMRMTWNGWRRIRMWKPSLPQVFTMYLLAQIRAASRAREREKSFNFKTT